MLPIRRISIVLLLWLNPLILLGKYPSGTDITKIPAKGKIPAGFACAQPLYFIENKGQITDQFHQPRPDVQYKLAVPGLNVFIGNGQLHYQWIINSPNDPHVLASGEASASGTTGTYRMDVTLVGANVNAKMAIEEQADYFETYYFPWFGNQGLRANSFKKLVYTSIYPGIDWVIFIKEGHLSYDFVVHPNGDVKDIHLKYDGTNNLSILNGSILASTPYGSISEHPPYCFEQESTKMILSQYVLEDGVIGFHTASYSGTLVIDPTVVWATYFGGRGDENGYGVAVDGNDNVYMCGTSSSSTNVATLGSFQTSWSGHTDATLSKFNSAGVLQWATYYGDTLNDEAYDVALDNNNNPVICGLVNGKTNITATPGSYRSQAFGGGYGFVGKFSSTGSKSWITIPIGTGSGDVTNSIAVDGSNNIYVGGTTTSNTTIGTSGTYQSGYGGATDAFLMKYSPIGVKVWGTYFGGNLEEDGASVAIDPSSNIYLCGYTKSTSTVATAGAQQTVYGGSPQYGNGFLAKFNSSGNRYWATYYGQTGSGVISVTCDKSSNVYISGRTKNTDTTVSTPNSYMPGNPYADTSIFIAKFNSAGARQWGTFYGRSGWVSESPSRIICDTNNYVYFTGNITSYTDHRISLTALDTLGQLQWDTTMSYGYGSGTYIYGLGLNRGHFYLSGEIISPGLGTTGAYQIADSGGYDAFLIKTNIDTVVYFPSALTDTNKCSGTTLRVPYKVNFPFYSGNVFTVQLSDSAGDFDAPVNIGSLTSSTNDTIDCLLPINTITSTGYRIRIVATSPVDTSVLNKALIHISKIPGLSINNNSPVCTGDTLKISASDSSSANYVFSWHGPGGFTASTPKIVKRSAALTDNGPYYLNVHFNACVILDTMVIAVNQRPVKPAVTSNSPVCLGNTLQFNASSSAGATFQWFGPDGFSSTDPNPSRSAVIAVDSGKYSVVATMNGCISLTDTVKVVVNTISLRDSIIFSGNGPICSGDTLRVTSLHTIAGIGYNWFGPNSFVSALKNIVIPNATITNSGIYYLNVSQNGCSYTDSVNVTVKQLPIQPAVGSNSPLCEGTNLLLTASSSTPGVIYLWSGPGSYSATTQNPVINSVGTGSSGPYLVTVMLNGCKSTNTTNVVVNPLPGSPSAGSNSPICGGQQLFLTSFTPTSGVTYNWDGPAGFTSTQQYPIITGASLAASGTYRLLISLNGCTDTLFVPVIVSPAAPPASVSIVVSPNDTLCKGSMVTFTPTPVNGGTTPSYDWKVNGIVKGTNFGAYSTTTLNDGDQVSCTMTSNALCQPVSSATANSNVIVMHVFPVASPLFVSIVTSPANYAPGILMTFSANVLNGGSYHTYYQWKLNGNNIPGATSNTYSTNTLAKKDKISVVVRSSLPCRVPDSATNSVTVSVSDVQIVATNFSIYPNPAKEEITINSSDVSIKNISMLIADVNGRQVMQRDVMLNHGNATLKLNLLPGVYAVHLMNDSQQMVQRLVIVN